MIKIKAEYYYYGGTFHAPKSGYLKDESENVLTFSTEKDALEYLNDFKGKMELVKGKATYANAGTYVLHHGEYSRPLYTLIKVGLQGKRVRRK